MTAFIQTRDYSDEFITKILNNKTSLIALNNMSKIALSISGIPLDRILVILSLGEEIPLEK